jgi:hypothetical protein
MPNARGAAPFDKVAAVLLGALVEGRGNLRRGIASPNRLGGRGINTDKILSRHLDPEG